MYLRECERKKELEDEVTGGADPKHLGKKTKEKKVVPIVAIIIILII